MAKTYTTKGIILKRRDYHEHDRLFCIYTKDYGKIDVLAKGTKKIVSKFNPYLEPFYLVDLMIAKGKIFDKLANANIVKTFSNLRSNLNGFFILNYLSEAIDNLILGQTTQTNKFEILLEVLDLLDDKIIKSNDKEKLLALANVYIFKLLKFLGYRPEIQRCVMCHKGILLTKNIFDFSHGGIICEDCKKVCLIEDYLKISDGAIKLLQLAEMQPLNYFNSLEAKPEDLMEFNQIITKLLLVNTEKPLKSLEFAKLF